MILMDKPKGWTSFDVINKLRFALKRKLNLIKIKVGHAGTLDPMATGLLLICVGRYTKRISEFQDLDKSYSGTLHLGATTPTFDCESSPDEHFSTGHITPEMLESARQKLTGAIQQIPPAYSAVKIKGKTAYRMARAGEEVVLAPREVTIIDFKLEKIEMPEITFEVSCSKGTYIRSLAYDFGKLLRSGAYLTALRRNSIGNFSVAEAWQVDEFVHSFLAP